MLLYKVWLVTVKLAGRYCRYGRRLFALMFLDLLISCLLHWHFASDRNITRAVEKGCEAQTRNVWVEAASLV